MPHLILALGLGLVVGAAGWWWASGRERGGWVISMLLGALGSLIAVLLGPLFGFYAEMEPASLAASVLGAVGIVLANSVRSGPKV